MCRTTSDFPGLERSFSVVLTVREAGRGYHCPQNLRSWLSCQRLGHGLILRLKLATSVTEGFPRCHGGLRILRLAHGQGLCLEVRHLGSYKWWYSVIHVP